MHSSFFVIFNQILGVTGFEIPCNLSTSTIEIVEQCPTDKQTYVEAAARKNCAAIDNSCDSFVYHCVFNVWRNATLEVCAPWLIIVGKNRKSGFLLAWLYWCQLLTAVHISFDNLFIIQLKSSTWYNGNIYNILARN